MSLGDRFDHPQAIPAVLSGLSSPEDMRRAARRFVARNALGAGDCGVLLEMLGLEFTAEEIAAVRQRSVNDGVIEDGDERT